MRSGVGVMTHPSDPLVDPAIRRLGELNAQAARMRAENAEQIECTKKRKRECGKQHGQAVVAGVLLTIFAVVATVFTLVTFLSGSGSVWAVMITLLLRGGAICNFRGGAYRKQWEKPDARSDSGVKRGRAD